MGQDRMGRDFRLTPAVIASGAAQSGRIAVQGTAMIGIVLPAAWDPADLTFLGAGDAALDANQPATAAWALITDNGATGTEVKLTAAFMAARVGDFITPAGILDALSIPGYIILRSGVKGAEINQTANRTFYIAMKA